MAIIRFVFTIFILVILTLHIWGLRGQYRNIQKLEDFTDQEKAVLKRQLLAVVPMSIFVVFFLLFFLGLSVSFSQLMWSGVLLSIPTIGYVAVSSIKHRVSLFRGKGARNPTRGKVAVGMGVVMIIGLLFEVIFVSIFTNIISQSGAGDILDPFN